VGRDAERQAVGYADTISGKLGLDLDIFVVGGEIDSRVQPEYSGGRTKLLSYGAVIANARTQIEWLLSQLNQAPRNFGDRTSVPGN
jgi:hypothetical protein